MNSLEAFRSYAALPDAQLDLTRGALLIAAGEYPDLPFEHYEKRVEALSSLLRSRIEGRPPEAALERAVRFLFDEEGFRGNEGDYYDPRNSFLNEVLDRKLGIPITLSLVLLEVSRKAGLPLVGIGFPGHFLVRGSGTSGPFVDAFHRGKLMSREDCARFFLERFGAEARLEDRHFQPVTSREMLVRMLRNLKGIYVQKRDFARALSAVDRILHLSPEIFEELRDRGLLYAALDCTVPAVRDLERYLHVAGDAADADEVRARLLTLRRSKSVVH